MKLLETRLTLNQSRFFHSDMPILESGEGPRWRFDYSNYKVDPSPDILLLGAYQHPRTKNNLVGGINLHYLTKLQIDELSKALPQIMQAGNLYSRYHAGKRMLPDVFEKFYRTYNSSYIHGVTQDTMYPKYGFMKTAADLIKKKIGGIFKSKAKRQKEAEPKFPDDLSNMQNRLNQAMHQLQRSPPPRSTVSPDTPEMQAARNAFLRFRRDQQQSMRDVERQENEPIQMAAQDQEQYEQPEYEQQPAYEQPEQPAQQAQPAQQVQQPDYQQQPAQPPSINFDKEREKNKAELLNPNNDLDLEESIIYYSPVSRKYIIESVSSTIFENINQLYNKLLKLQPRFAMAAQRIYNEWTPEEDDFAGGGICDEIADAISSICADNGIDTTYGGHDGDDHAYIIAYDDQETYVVDIPHHIYEYGGGYSWTKRNGVQFDAADVVIAEVDRPDWVDDDFR